MCSSDLIGRSEGIRLSGQVPLYPVQYSSVYRNVYYEPRMPDFEGEIVQQGDDQIHRGDFLPSRRQVQYLTMDVNEVAGAIRFSSQDLVATNSLEMDFEKLLVRDISGKYWIVSDLKAGESQVMRATDRAALDQLLGEIVIPFVGEVPSISRTNYQPIQIGRAHV